MPASLAPFNPFGVWVALCFVLQGVGAWWIARELRVGSWVFLVALLVILITFPALMFRIGHISLMSHWILLFAIALYIRSHRNGSLPQWAWSLLLVTGFYINIYLFVMACGVLLATLFSLGRSPARRDILAFLLPFALLAISAFLLLLPLPPGGVTREWGFGYFSMNLLAPLIGGKLFALQAEVGSGQYEGFNYLGLGVLLALLWAWYLKGRTVLDGLRRHRPLFLLLLLYSVFALSNRIYFAGHNILVLSYPGILDGLTAQFRVSGRFFWLVGYCAAIFSLLMLYRGLGARAFTFVAILLVGLQLADLEDRHRSLSAFVDREPVRPLDFAVWDAELGQHVQVLYFYPKFKCAQHGHFQTLLPVMSFAAERGSLKLNTGYIARYTPDCHDAAHEIAGSDPARSAYIFVRAEFESLEAIMALFPNPSKIRCSAVQFAYVCQNVQNRAN